MTIVHAFKLCTIALAIGAVLATPGMSWRAPRLFVDSFKLTSLPANDKTLQAWFRGHENVLDLEIRRTDEGLKVSYVREGLASDRLQPPWSELSYGQLSGAELSNRISFARMFQDPWTSLILLGCSQIGFVLVATRVRKRLRAEHDGSLSPWRRSTKSDIGWGVLGGLLMIGVGFGYDLFLHVLKVDQRAVAGPWAAISEIPLIAFLVVFLGATILAPVCEELFFRGTLFEGFQNVGRTSQRHSGVIGVVLDCPPRPYELCGDDSARRDSLGHLLANQITDVLHCCARLK